MKTLSAILTAIALILGLSACNLEMKSTQGVKAEAQVVKPTTEAVGPPTIVHSPKVTLAAAEVVVTTKPAPAPQATPAPLETTASFIRPLSTSTPAYQVPVYPVVPVEPVVTCEEDMPCWDCSTMGNLQCGGYVDPYSGNTETPESCAEQALIWVEDSTCAYPSFFQTVDAPVTPVDTVKVPATTDLSARPDVDVDTLTEERDAVLDPVGIITPPEVEEGTVELDPPKDLQENLTEPSCADSEAVAELIHQQDTEST